MDRAIREMQSGIERRKLGDKFSLFQKYTGEQLDRSAGTKTFSDKTGNCRLTCIDCLLRNSLESLARPIVSHRSCTQRRLDPTAYLRC